MVAPALCNCDILALFDVHETELSGLQCMCWLTVHVVQLCSADRWCIEGQVFGVRSTWEEIFCLCSCVYVLTGSGTLLGLSDDAGPAWWLWCVFSVGSAPSKIIRTRLFLYRESESFTLLFFWLGTLNAVEVCVWTSWHKFQEVEPVLLRGMWLGGLLD